MKHRIGLLLASFVVCVSSFQTQKPSLGRGNNRPLYGFYNRGASSKTQEPTYPESKPATYELLKPGLSFEFGPAGLVRPLLKQTQLEKRPLQVAYNAKKHGWNTRAFHSKVDGKGAAVVLAKVGGQWCGGYNPRGKSIHAYVFV